MPVVIGAAWETDVPGASRGKRLRVRLDFAHLMNPISLWIIEREKNADPDNERRPTHLFRYSPTESPMGEGSIQVGALWTRVGRKTGSPYLSGFLDPAVLRAKGLLPALLGRGPLAAQLRVRLTRVRRPRGTKGQTHTLWFVESVRAGEAGPDPRDKAGSDPLYRRRPDPRPSPVRGTGIEPRRHDSALQDLATEIRKIAAARGGQALSERERLLVDEFAQFTQIHFGLRRPEQLGPVHYTRYLGTRLPPESTLQERRFVRDTLAALADRLDSKRFSFFSAAPRDEEDEFIECVTGSILASPPFPSDRAVMVDAARFFRASGVREVSRLGRDLLERYLVDRIRRGNTAGQLGEVRRILGDLCRRIGLRESAVTEAWQSLSSIVRLSHQGGSWTFEPHSPAGEAGLRRARVRRHGDEGCAVGCPGCAHGIPVGVWWTGDAIAAARLPIETDPATYRALMNEVAEKKRRSLALSRAKSGEIEVPAPAGRAYLPYQKAAIAYALDRPNTLNADEPGLGKTIEALGVVNADPSIRTVLVVCPASLRANWRREAQDWLVRPARIWEVETNDAPPEAADFVVVSYQRLLGAVRVSLMARRWDLLIADEAHLLKNPDAQRTKALLGCNGDGGLLGRAERVLFLTGTPILNRLGELHTLVSSLDPQEGWGTKKEFLRKFERSDRLEELQKRLRETILVRRLKAEVLPDLPEKRRSIIVLPRKVAEREIAAEREVLAQAAEEVREATARAAALATAGDSESYRRAVEDLQTTRMKVLSEIGRARHRVALAKVPSVVAHLQGLFESGVEKVVLWAHHRDVIESLRRQFERESVVLSGETPPSERPGVVARFQADPSARLFIGSILAGGLGITLTAAAWEVFAELDWTPANVTQAEDRCHRIGQKRGLLVQHLVVDGSLDAHMTRLCVAKQDLIRDALDAAGRERPDASLDLALRFGGEAA